MTALSTNKFNMLTVVAGKPVVPGPSNFLDLPGEIRNKIYDHVFGSKALQILPQYTAVSASGKVDRFSPRILDTKNRGLYTLRLTCHQIATETELYLYQTLDLSNRSGMGYFLAKGAKDDLASLHNSFKQMLHGRWHHIHHLSIMSFAMGSIIGDCGVSYQDFHLPAITNVCVDTYPYRQSRISWPADARNLTTLTIHDMNKRKAEERGKLLKILRFYFPKLVDVRCAYTGDSPCMRRYRITDDGQLKWWYTGEAFKKLPEEPTASAWLNQDSFLEECVPIDLMVDLNLDYGRSGDAASQPPRQAAW